MPADRDLGADVLRGQQLANRPVPEKLATLANWFWHGPMDYQREEGKKFNPAYQDAANYLYGAVTAAAGIPEWLGRDAGVGFNLLGGRIRSGPWGTPRRNYDMWSLGRSDYLNNRLAFPGVQPAGPPMVYPPPIQQDPNTAVPFPGLFPVGPPMRYEPPTPDDPVFWPVPPS